MSQEINTISPLLINIAKREAHILLDEVKGVVAVVVASIDGFDIASAIQGNMDPSRIAATASSIAAIGAVVAQEADLGKPTNIMINTENGFVQVFSVRRKDIQLVINIISDSTGVLALVAYRGARFAQLLQDV